MAVYKEGTITGTGSAINLALGFVPSKIRLLNQTTLASGVGVFCSEWFFGMANASAYTITTAGTPVHAYAAANGFTPFQTGDASLYTETVMTLTGISQAAQAVVLTASTLPIILGDVVTFSGVVGMTQINTLRGKIVAINPGVSFTVDINTTGFSAYSSGGEANLITTPALPTQNLGKIGITLGTAVAGAASDVIRYEAFLDAPFTS
jgi:hypothetical protein